VTDQTPEEAAFTGTIVVIMPARNEGEWPRKTVENFRAAKAPGTDLVFAVVDEANEDDSVACLRGEPDVVYLSSLKEPTGQGIARSRAVVATRHLEPRAYLSIDAHMGMATPEGVERLVLTAEETGGVVQSWNGVLTTGVIQARRGATWKMLKRNGYIKPDTENDYRIEPGPLLDVDVLAGACYAFTPATFDRLGGFGESFGYYGFFERDLAVNCRFLGIPQLCDGRVISLHHYRVARPYAMGGVWRVRGMVQCWRSKFRPEVWDRVWRPYVDAVQKKHADPIIDYLLHAPWIDTLQRAYEPEKVVTDEEVLEWMGVPA